MLVAPIEDSFILGLDFLKAHSGVIDLKEDTVNLNGYRTNAQMRKNKNEKYSVQRVTLARKVVVPPNTEIIAGVQFSVPSSKTFLVCGPEMYHKGMLIPYALVSLKNSSCTNLATTCNIRLRNDSNKYVHLKKGHVIGRAEEIDDVVPSGRYYLNTDSSHGELSPALVGRPLSSGRQN